MTLRSSLFIFGIGSAFAWTAFILILVTVPPETAGPVGEAFLGGALFLGLTGVLTMLGLLGRVRASALLPVFHLGPAFRQGFLLAAAAVSLLLLQRFRVLAWWNILVLFVVLLVVDVVLARRDLKPS